MSDKTDLINQIKELVGNGHVSTALEVLQEASRGSIFQNEAILQSARYQAIMQHDRSGVIDKKMKLTEVTDISSAILGLLNEIENSPVQENFSRTKEEARPYIGAITHYGQGSIVAGDQIIGDTTTNAQTRYENALSVIIDEIQKNFIILSALITAFGTNQPHAFDDFNKRRINETEPDYQHRAKAHHQRYINHIGWVLQEFRISTESYHAHRINLSHQVETNRLISDLYENQQLAYDSVEFYFKSIKALFQEFNNDASYTETIAGYFSEKIISSKIQFTYALFLAGKLVPAHFNVVNISRYLSDLSVIAPEESVATTPMESILAKLYDEKKKAIEATIKFAENPNKRQIERQVNDPYILSLRAQAGLNSALSEGEAWALSNKIIDEQETDPQKLIALALFAFIESDGEAALYYLEKAGRHPDLPKREQSFLDLSVERLKNPDLYDGSLGVLILTIWENGSLKEAGLNSTDVIYMVNNELLSDATALAYSLGAINERGQVVLKYRDSKSKTHHTAVIKGGKPAGALLTSLVVWHPIQL